MDNLPREILEEIFRFLHPQDISECLAVCHRWNRFIKNYVPFDTVCLHTYKQLSDFASSMKQDLSLSRKIERLIINKRHTSSDEINSLLLTISNVQEVYIYGCIKEGSFPFTNPSTSHPWSKTIRKIQENESDIFTTHILKTGVCPVLKDISIHGPGTQLEAALIPLLLNVPSLKTLSITSYVISLENMELVHDVTPQLSTLMIYNSTISSTILPTGIRPATSISSLTLENTVVSTARGYINFNKYLAIKYPEVTKISYGIFQRGPGINDGVRRRESFASLINQIGSHLTALKIDENMKCRYIIPIVDDSNCCIEEFDFDMPVNPSEVHQLVQSKQARYIKTLTIPNLSERCVGFLQSLSVLTELNLSGTSNSSKIDMNTLINSVGNTLITLRLCYIKVVLTVSSTRPCPSMRHLLIKQSRTGNNLDHFISQSFPKLQRLILDDVAWKGSTFYLGDLTLSYLELRVIFPLANPYVLVSTISNNEKRWYKTKIGQVQLYEQQADPFVLPVVETFPFNKRHHLPYIAFVCHSLRGFFLVSLPTSGY